MKFYKRHPETRQAPPELLEVHPLGKSPVITDGSLTLAETGAIVGESECQCRLEQEDSSELMHILITFRVPDQPIRQRKMWDRRREIPSLGGQPLLSVSPLLTSIKPPGCVELIVEHVSTCSQSPIMPKAQSSIPSPSA
jgi:hypothetical protein